MTRIFLDQLTLPVMTRIFLDQLTLPDSGDLALLSEYGIEPKVKQRKSYDEYYVISQETEADVSVEDLIELANNFTIEVTRGGISIKN